MPKAADRSDKTKLEVAHGLNTLKIMGHFD